MCSYVVSMTLCLGLGEQKHAYLPVCNVQSWKTHVRSLISTLSQWDKIHNYQNLLHCSAVADSSPKEEPLLNPDICETILAGSVHLLKVKVQSVVDVLFIPSVPFCSFIEAVLG